MKFSFGIADVENNKGNLSIVSVNDILLSDAIQKANLQVNQPLRDAQIQDILLSETLAKEGLLGLTDIDKLEAVSRFLPDFIIVEESPEDFLKALKDFRDSL